MPIFWPACLITISLNNKPLGKNQGRGVASGYWFNGGGESSATVQINTDGTLVVAPAASMSAARAPRWR